MVRNQKQSERKTLKDKQILVVEDGPILGKILTAMLTRFDNPSHADSEKEALKQIKQKKPNIILLDLSLPDMKGLELARLLRQNETTKSIRILAISGSPMDRRKWLRAGCAILSSNHLIHPPCWLDYPN